MRPDEAIERSRQWLEAQLDELGGLRNAHPRDPGFKTWRQSTLTVLQRIWPGDATRLERFRSIRFHAPGTRNDAKTTREYYERGCAEAVHFLRGMLEDVVANGVPDAEHFEQEISTLPGTAEDDFPTLELPQGDVKSSAGGTAIPESTDIILDLGGPSAAAPIRAQADTRDADAPAPPALPASASRASRTSGAGSRAARAGGPAKAAKSSKRGGVKQRLRDMLGLDSLEAESKPIEAQPTDEPAAAAPPAPLEEPARPAPATKKRPKRTVSIESLISPEFRQRMSQPQPQPPAAPAPVAEAPPPPVQFVELVAPLTPVAALTPPAPVTAIPPPPAPVVAVSPPPAVVESVPPPEPVVEIAPPPVVEVVPPPPAPVVEFVPPQPLAAVPPPPPVAVTVVSPPPISIVPPPAPVESPAVAADDGALDPDAIERATLDFISNSPVLSLQGRPVQRMSDGTSHQNPDAVAIATLAADIGRLGVPEGRRAGARASLIDLARRLEDGSVDWPLLRDMTTYAMDYPELAKRLLPVLLPWLDRAA